MNPIKLSPLLASALVSLSTVFALPAFSQSNQPTAPTQRHQMRPPILNLTAEQQAQIEQIREDKRSQIDAILTAEQKAQLQQAQENRNPHARENRGMPRLFASLNLSDEQRSQIEAVMRSSKEEMDAILTPEQRQQLQEHRQQHQARPQVPQNR